MASDTLDLVTRNAIKQCDNCGLPPSEHERERVYPDDGPSGTYHYEYYCP